MTLEHGQSEDRPHDLPMAPDGCRYRYFGRGVWLLHSGIGWERLDHVVAWRLAMRRAA